MEKENDIRITLGSFNLLKGIAIMLVILRHILYFHDAAQLQVLKPLSDFLLFWGSGILPAFILINGYNFKQKRTGDMLKTTFRCLIVPYLWVAAFFMVAYFIVSFIAYGSLDWSAEVTLRWAIAFLMGIPKSGHWLWGCEIAHCSAVWFLLALFIAMNLLNIILRLKNRVCQLCAVLLCVLLGYWMLIRDINYYTIPQGLLGVGYCWAGYLLREHKLLTRTVHWAWACLAAAVVALIRYCCGDINLALGEVDCGLWSYGASLIVAVFFVYLGLHVGRENQHLDWIRNIGLHSYWILCIHAVENECMHWWFFIDAMPNQYVALLGEIVIKTAIIYVFCKLLKKIQMMRFKRKRGLNGK